MKRLEPQSIGDVLRKAIDDAQMSGHLDELRAAEFWPSIVGQHIADECRRPYILDGRMSVRVPDAALRQELNMQRSLIISEFNRLAGKPVVKSLRFY